MFKTCVLTTLIYSHIFLIKYNLDKKHQFSKRMLIFRKH